MKIKKKKCLKVNIYFVLSFKQKQVVPFWKGEKLPKHCYKYFSREKCDFFGVFDQKNWKGWPDNFKTFHNEKSGVWEKKPRKREFYGSSPSCSNWVPKIWPITKQHSESANQWRPRSQIFLIKPARLRARRACALRALGLLLADGTPTVGGGKILTGQLNFFTETALTPEWKVEKSFPMWEINRHAEG